MQILFLTFLGTSQHWHGLFQHGTNYNDGPAFVTQCPIIPENSYQYDFEVLDQVRVAS
jgi:iron transport multicopper oxidase